MNTIDVIKEVSNTIDAIGEEATVSALVAARDSNLKPKYVKCIFDIVCSELGFKINTPNDLKVKTDERKAIIAFVAFFSYKKLKGMTCTDLNVIGITFSKQLFTNYKKVIEYSNRKKPISNLEVIISKHYQNINDKINDLIKNK